jgi:hypothetical protein
MVMVWALLPHNLVISMMKHRLIISVLSSIWISTGLFGCSSVSPVLIHRQQTKELSGRVFFPDGVWQLATAEQIRIHATVSLLYPPDHATEAHRTAAAGSTNAQGAFQLTLNPHFTPVAGELYILEASRRVGSSQQRQALRTWVRRTENSWESLSGESVVLDACTTALSALLELKMKDPHHFMGAITLTGQTTAFLNEVGEVIPSEVEEATTLVSELLLQGKDPVAALAYQNNQVLPGRIPNPQTEALSQLLHCPFCDLSGEDLSGKNLNFANLQGADLSYANLQNATLLNANLEQTKLQGAQLGGASWFNGKICEAGSVGVCQSEFEVNEYTLGWQEVPRIGSDAQGNFVVVWQGTSGRYDYSGYGISARRFDPLGVPLSDEFLVNTFTSGDQQYPDIAVASNGHFVVVWQSQGDDPTGHKTDIFVRRYNNLGVAETLPQRVNTFSTENQLFPKVAIDDQGNSVVVWYCDQRRNIFAQRFDANMQPLGNEIAVPQATQQAGYPAVAMSVNGQFSISWTDRDADFTGVFVRSFDSQGVPLSNDIPVNQYTLRQQEFSQVAMAANGQMVVTWHSQYQDEGGIDSVPGGSGNGVYARQFDLHGNALSDEFKVNTTTRSMQRYPVIAMAPEGHFAIAWESYGQDHPDEMGASGVYLQRFMAGGAPLGSEQQVNTYIPSHQGFPAVSWGGNGALNLAWSSYGQEYYDPSAPGPTLLGVFGKQIGFWP